MEAANLGAWLAGSTRERPRRRRWPSWPGAVVPALGRGLGATPRFEVRERFPDGAESLGIPTWHYGHEPPNVFATAIAKYFRNATREAILLEVCDAGIVFLPGAGGTVQEVFQDACENYYADESSVAPMVLVGRTYWTETCPPGRCCAPWPAGGRWRGTCTSSTPSRRPRSCWPAYRRDVLVCRASRPRPAGRRRRRSRGRGCRAPWWGCPSPRAGARTRARRPGRRRSTSSPGVGLSGIRLTCTQPQSPYEFSTSASRSARQAWSLMPRIMAYSIDTRRLVTRA